MDRHHRQVVLAHLQQHVAAGHGIEIVGARLQGFDHRAHRQDEHLLAHLDGHAVEDRQGERQHDAGGGALAGRGENFHMPAHGLDVALDHVHADAAPGHVADRVGGGKARRENQLPDFVVAH